MIYVLLDNGLKSLSILLITQHLSFLAELLLKLGKGKSAKIDLGGWHRIDQVERKAGEACGKPREKLTSVREMLEAALA